MLAVKHPNREVWILLDCVGCGDGFPNSLYVPGFGSIIRSYDDEIRIFAPRNIKRREYLDLYHETMEHYRSKERIA